MLALLKLIPLKDYLWAALVAGLLVWFNVHNHNERAAGAQEALAPVAVLAQKVKTEVAVGTAVAQTTESSNAQKYKAAVAAPAPRYLGIVCHRDTGSSAVPEANPGVTTPAGIPADDSGGGPGYDPSPAALERAAQADAQITYLQGRVKELEAQMEASP